MDYHSDPYTAAKRVLSLKQEGKKAKDIAEILEINSPSASAIISKLNKLATYDEKIFSLCKQNGANFLELDKWFLRNKKRISFDDFRSISGLKSQENKILPIHLKSVGAVKILKTQKKVAVKNGGEEHFLSVDYGPNTHILNVGEVSDELSSKNSDSRKSSGAHDVKILRDFDRKSVQNEGNLRESPGAHDVKILRDLDKSNFYDPAVKSEDPAVKSEDPAVKSEDPAVKSEDPAVKNQKNNISARRTAVKFWEHSILTVDGFVDWLFGGQNKIRGMFALTGCLMTSTIIIAMSHSFFKKMDAASDVLIPLPFIGEVSALLITCIVFELSIPFFGKIGSRLSIAVAIGLIGLLTFFTIGHSLLDNYSKAQELKNKPNTTLLNDYKKALAEYDAKEIFEKEQLASIQKQIDDLITGKNDLLADYSGDYKTKKDEIDRRKSENLADLNTKKEAQLKIIRNLKKPKKPELKEVSDGGLFEGWTLKMWIAFFVALFSRIGLNTVNLLFSRHISGEHKRQIARS